MKQTNVTLYKVLKNIKGQYGLWPSFKSEIPWGWKETGASGTKEECSEYINNVWQDMKPCEK